MMDVLNSSATYLQRRRCKKLWNPDRYSEAKELILGATMDAPAENIVMYGNASLTLMFDTLAVPGHMVFAEALRGANSTK